MSTGSKYSCSKFANSQKTNKETKKDHDGVLNLALDYFSCY